jgi:CheY-like chemotaxis protein
MTEATAFDDRPAVVLVIDDNATNRYIVGSWLRRAGHRMIEAADGAQGLAILASASGPDRPEVAIVDVRLPDMSGFEVCEWIKADPRTAGLPVVHVSAVAVATADRTQGLHRGADAYLTEPIAPSELLATVAAVLRYARARSRAERLAERLALLNEATLDVHGAVDEAGFAAAAVRGAARLVPGGAMLLTEAAAGGSVRMTVTATGDRVESDLIRPGVVQRLSRLALGARVGAQGVRVPGEEWAGHFPGSGLKDDVVMVLARSKRGRPALCLAVDAEEADQPGDIKIMTQFAQSCSLALESLRSYSEEHSLALTLQRTFLPDRLPHLPGIRLAMRYLPALTESEIGGDFYEAVEMPGGLLLAVGDVAGHSLQAAIVMGELRHALRAYAVEGHGPRTLLERLDTLMVRQRPGWTATLCLALVRPDSREVEIANAGHLPPLFLDPDGGAHYVPDHGALLGLGVTHPPSVTCGIEPGSRILMVTDGLIERRGVDLGLSLEHLRNAASAGPQDPEGLCDWLLEQFGQEHPEDDTVLFVALFDGESELDGSGPGAGGDTVRWRGGSDPNASVVF